MKEEIPELYIAMRNLAKNLGADCNNPKNFIEEECCKMSQPNSDWFQHIFKKEDIKKWEKILQEKK